MMDNFPTMNIRCFEQTPISRRLGYPNKSPGHQSVGYEKSADKIFTSIHRDDNIGIVSFNWAMGTDLKDGYR